MFRYNLHIVDSCGALNRHRPLIEASLGDVMPRAAHLGFAAALDIVVQPGKRVIPQRGAVGHAPRPGGRWFFGTADLPDRAGYTWAYHHPGAWLARNRDESAAGLATTDAARFAP